MCICMQLIFFGRTHKKQQWLNLGKQWVSLFTLYHSVPFTFLTWAPTLLPFPLLARPSEKVAMQIRSLLQEPTEFNICKHSSQEGKDQWFSALMAYWEALKKYLGPNTDSDLICMGCILAGGVLKTPQVILIGSQR